IVPTCAPFSLYTQTVLSAKLWPISTMGRKPSRAPDLTEEVMQLSLWKRTLLGAALGGLAYGTPAAAEQPSYHPSPAPIRVTPCPPVPCPTPSITPVPGAPAAPGTAPTPTPTPSPTTTPPTAPSTAPPDSSPALPSRSFGALATSTVSVPNMQGHQLSIPALAFTRPGIFAERSSIAVPSVRNFKICDNESPRPQDRFFFDFNYFDSVN